MLHVFAAEVLRGRGHDFGREQQFLGSCVLVTTRLDDDVAGADSHPIADHLLVAAVEQAQGNQYKGQPRPQREGRQQGSARTAPEIAPSDLCQYQNPSHC